MPSKSPVATGTDRPATLPRPPHESARQPQPSRSILAGMVSQPATSEIVTTTIGTFYRWADTPTTVAMVFALAAAVFVGICAFRRLRRGKATDKRT